MALRMANKKVDEDEATLALIEMALLFRRGNKTMVPVTIRAVRNFKALLGIESLATKEGICYWQFPQDMSVNLERIGIDPATLICVDRGKFNLALLELEQGKAAELEVKYAGQDLEARSAAIKEAMQRYRPTKPPRTASPQHYLYNDYQNRRIAREIRQAQEEDEERGSLPRYNPAGRKCYPPLGQDDSGCIKLHE
jgi:hypothetical protein